MEIQCSHQMDQAKKKKVDTIMNRILDGSESFQDDINFNHHWIKNVHMPATIYYASNQIFCKTRFHKLADDFKQ